jgi:hypothetical protein
VERLKPQDIVLALKLVAHGKRAWKQPELAKALHISASEVNHGLRRLAVSHLYNAEERRVVRASLKEFLVHGLRYAFPAQLGMLGEGMVTAYSAKPLAEKLLLGPEDNVVWLVRDARHSARGHTIEPLYRTAPRAAAEDPALHELLALVDTLRVGRARERALATEELGKRLEVS